MARKRIRAFTETFVIYQSEEDKRWIAHGLRTDQMGYGDCMVDALVDYMKAIDQILRVAVEEKDIQILREAPPEVQARAKTAQRLPREIFEIAHKRVRGEWPADLTVEAMSSDDAVYKAHVREPVPA
jgi:hypothetical protein